MKEPGRRYKYVKCPICGKKFVNPGAANLITHMNMEHEGTIPEDWSDGRYFYYALTGNSTGSCPECHGPTKFNELTWKYERYCSNPKCKQNYIAKAHGRVINRYGFPLATSPEFQRKMLAARRISGTYKFSDGGSVTYTGSYELDFLKYIDKLLGFSSNDIIGPSPNSYTYVDGDGKAHLYLPDFFIPSLNLELEIKDGGDNPNNHPKIQAVDKDKERRKDEVMAKNPKVNYLKIINKNNAVFFQYLMDSRETITPDETTIK